MLFVPFCFITFLLCAQQKQTSILINQNELIGVWQKNTSLITSGLEAFFRFYRSGKFIYNRSSYDELNPLLSIYGNYKLVDSNALGLKVDSSKQLIGYQIIAASSGFQFGTFVLFGGKMVTTPQKGTGYEFHDISVYRKGKQIKCIVIDNDKYYKLSNNPDASF